MGRRPDETGAREFSSDRCTARQHARSVQPDDGILQQVDGAVERARAVAERRQERRRRQCAEEIVRSGRVGPCGGWRLRPRARASDRRTDLRDPVGSRPQAAERTAAFAAAPARYRGVSGDRSGRVAIGFRTIFPRLIGRVAAADQQCARTARPVGRHGERDADRDASHAEVPRSPAQRHAVFCRLPAAGARNRRNLLRGASHSDS